MEEVMLGAIAGKAAHGMLGTIAQKAADIAINLIKEGSRLSSVKELVWIQTVIKILGRYLEDADAMQVKSEAVSNFIREIWDLAYDVEDIINTFFSGLSSNSSNLRIRRGFSIKVEGIKIRVEDIKIAKQTYGIDESRPSHEEGKWDAIRRSFPHVHEPNVVGFDDLIQKLEQKVVDHDLHHRVVSVIGMGGLGKTTLAKKVYNSVRQRFDCSAWICVSQRPIVKELLQDIGRQVGLGQLERDVEANLFTFLSGKRYVIVVDDIWDTEVWDALKNGIPTNSKYGSRIILTSRNRDVGVYVGGPNSIVEVQPLDPETSRKLFYKMIMDDGPQNVSETQVPPQLEKIADQILKRCGGAPLAIVLAAGLLKLRKRSEVAWKAVLEGMGQEHEQCAHIFALSYYDLPINLKPCFLCFGLFPMDREISVFELINLWAGEGLIRGSRVREVEKVGEDYLNYLIARNMIQVVKRRFNGKVRSCCIHGVLHTLCIRVANAINFFYHQGGSINPFLMPRRATIHDFDPSYYIQTSHLRALFYFSTGRRADNLDLLKSKFLRVLSVESSDIARSSIPSKISNLSQLTYLKLGESITSSCLGQFGHFELPYAIRKLTCLQTLDVRDLRSVILPNVIWSMKQLRHILLPTECHAPSSREFKLDMFHRVEFSLPNLQTLYGLPGHLFKPEWLNKLKNLRTLRVNFPTNDIIEVLSRDAMPVSHKLEELHLWDTSIRVETVSWNLSQFVNLSKLKINGVSMTGLPRNDNLPPNLTKITLRGTYLDMDPMETLKELPKLKILKLYGDSYKGHYLVCSRESGNGNFPQLQVLEIDSLHDLRMLVVEEGGMPRLTDFKICGCDPEIRIPNMNIMTRGRRS